MTERNYSEENYDDTVDLRGLDRAEVLAALYNNSRPLGMGFLDPQSRDKLTTEEATKLLEETMHFDYLQGRVMKINLNDDDMKTWLYNRDNGPGAAEKIVNELRERATS